MKDIKQKLMECGKLLYREEAVIGAGGNISARSKNKIYIKASGSSLKDSKRSDYNEVDLKNGSVVCVKGPCSIEVQMHIACYRARPDIGAVIHTHPVYGTAAGMMAKKIGNISYEFIVAMKSEVPAIDYKKAGSLELAESVKKAIKRHNGILLKNHGIIVVGKDLKEAYMRALALERACRVYVFAKLANRLSFLPKSELKRLSRP